MTLAEWTGAWDYIWREAQDRYAGQIAANPKAYEPQVTTFIQELSAVRGWLDRLKVRLASSKEPTKDFALYNRLAREHYELSTRFYSDARPAQPGMGFAPIMIVLGIAIGVAGCAWAAAAWQYARGLRERTVLAAQELEARIVASKEGRVLQTSTLPPPESPSLMGGIGSLVTVGLVVAAGAFLLPRLSPKLTSST
jgi:hypothetical protein